jgi:hypothetical protein
LTVAITLSSLIFNIPPNDLLEFQCIASTAVTATGLLRPSALEGELRRCRVTTHDDC